LEVVAKPERMMYSICIREHDCSRNKEEK